jgi:hypothetical protein
VHDTIDPARVWASVLRTIVSTEVPNVSPLAMSYWMTCM